jgi:hypothetical protein
MDSTGGVVEEMVGCLKILQGSGVGGVLGCGLNGRLIWYGLARNLLRAKREIVNMKFLNPVLLLALVGAIVGCGTSQAPAVNLGTGQYPYTNTGTNNWTNGNQTGGWTYGLPGGGTKTIIPVISYYGYANSSRQFMISPSVQPGDQVEVAASGGQVTAQGLFGSSNMIWVTQLKVTLNGSLLGASTYGKYNVTQAGTLGISFEANGLSGLFGNNAQYMVSFPYGGVWINRCQDQSGQSITCP